MTRLRAAVLYLPEPLLALIDDLRREHDPQGARAIRAHVTVAHRMTEENIARLPATRGTGKIRLGFDGPVALGFAPTPYGAGLMVLDLDDGIARLSANIGVPMTTLPHVTVLHPRHSGGLDAQRAAFDAAERLSLPREFIASAVTCIEEHDDTWHDVETIAL